MKKNKKDLILSLVLTILLTILGVILSKYIITSILVEIILWVIVVICFISTIFIIKQITSVPEKEETKEIINVPKKEETKESKLNYVYPKFLGDKTLNIDYELQPLESKINEYDITFKIIPKYIINGDNKVFEGFKLESGGKYFMNCMVDNFPTNYKELESIFEVYFNRDYKLKELFDYILDALSENNTWGKRNNRSFDKSNKILNYIGEYKRKVIKSDPLKIIKEAKNGYYTYKNKEELMWFFYTKFYYSANNIYIYDNDKKIKLDKNTPPMNIECLSEWKN